MCRIHSLWGVSDGAPQRSTWNPCPVWPNNLSLSLNIISWLLWITRRQTVNGSATEGVKSQSWLESTWGTLELVGHTLCWLWVWKRPFFLRQVALGVLSEVRLVSANMFLAGCVKRSSRFLFPRALSGVGSEIRGVNGPSQTNPPSPPFPASSLSTLHSLTSDQLYEF